MTARQLFLELSKEPFWARQRKVVRWIAARYYCGIEKDIRPLGFPIQIGVRGLTLKPLLSQDEIKLIREMR